MDRNSIIGFSLLAALLIGYMVYNNNAQQKFEEQQKAKFVLDSIASAKIHPVAAVDSSKLVAPVNAISDSEKKLLPPAFNGTAQKIHIENKKLALDFSTKGANPVKAEIKGYKAFDEKPLVFFDGDGNQLSVDLPLAGGPKSTSDMYFTPTQKTEPNGDQTVDFVADLGNGQKVDILYTILADDYMMRCNIRVNGINAKSFPLTWQTYALRTEKNLTIQRRASGMVQDQVYYRYKNNDHDYFTIPTDGKSQDFTQPVNWVGFRQNYFTTALIADDGFTKGNVETFTKIKKTPKTEEVMIEDTMAKASFVMQLPAAGGTDQSFNLRWYIGPNSYQTLKSYQAGLEDMVPLGVGIFAFTKYVNKWIILPVFDFLSTYITNYGIIIILLTIFIRLILSFFTYKSYLSAAKMRVLKPEIDELRAKYGEDQQKFGVEQMKLYRTAGVNPLGGCLPTLFQLPILVAMYSFFPSSIELRQKPFLWAHDLSTYDSIFSWTNDIPILSSVYGNHISLFTLLMTASSLFLALYNKNMTAQDPNNPLMKWMPYIFPIILMGVFNKMAAALTFYYFFSNMISIAQQYIIQKFIINEDKIHAQIKENRNKPATPSKWQQKIEEMQKSQVDKLKQKPIRK